jgi:peptidoglycan/xylan/chitin deacetylase (PgdA/CDA1 family)
VIGRVIKLLVSVIFGACDALLRPFAGHRFARGVVINYHSISDASKSRFGQQLDVLSRLASPIHLGKESPLEKGRRFVTITVDDVFHSFVTNGLPELCRRNIPVMLFPPTGYLGRNSSWTDYGGENKVGEAVVSADDLKQIATFKNVDFGSHGVMHADLALLPEAGARQELEESKRSLEALVGREIIAFSFPYGSYGARELRLASEAGYKMCFDSTPQQILSPTQPGLIGRVDVQPTDWNLEFRLKVCGAYRWVRWASAWKKKIRLWLGAASPGKMSNHG